MIAVTSLLATTQQIRFPAVTPTVSHHPYSNSLINAGLQPNLLSRFPTTIYQKLSQKPANGQRHRFSNTSKMELAKKHDSKTRTKGANSDKRSEKSDSSSSRKTKISRFRMKMRMMSGLAMSEMMHPTKDHVTCENTYKVEPDDGRKFSPHKAEQIIQGVFDTFLSGRSYDSRRFPILSKTLAELIKERTKASGVERYKIVALVTICEDQDQSMRLASRCLWNQNYDNYASLIFQGAGFYAVGSVYAFYFE